MNGSALGLIGICFSESTDQHIIWSTLGEHTKSGLGLQQTFGDYVDVDWAASFALHMKRPLTGRLAADAEYCRRIRGCDANYLDNGTTFQSKCQHADSSLAAS